MITKDYFLGVDVGTDSVGYAVSDEDYKLIKFKGEPMWGVTTFEAANPSEQRRAFRTARRRLDRRQQRVALIGDLFASEIVKNDPSFFIRRKESALSRTDKSSSSCSAVFDDVGFSDKEYNKMYPTVHHLIYELMTNSEAHDVRLVYQACAWLVAHRGHFLTEVDRDSIEEVLDFSLVYSAFLQFFAENGTEAPWSCETHDFGIILKKKKGVTAKGKDFWELLFEGKKPKDDMAYPYDKAVMIQLLCGGKASPQKLFKNETYDTIPSFSLDMEEEALASLVLAELGDDAELILRMKAMYDWAVLTDILAGQDSISAAKIKVYEQHKADLTALKKFVREYLPDQYPAIFRAVGKDANYVLYIKNLKSAHNISEKTEKVNKATKEDFSKYLLSIIKNVVCKEEDKPFYDDMVRRLELRSFLPKQVDPDNRVIPHQLYRMELKKVLSNAQTYLPFLCGKDDADLSVSEKILSVFSFRVPYYVGPLNHFGNEHAWIIRKAGKIYPWNFDSLVNRDESEQAFIRRMTKTCTYMPGKPVLPKWSLLYCKYNVLNEINNLKIDDKPISVACKQAIYNELFTKQARVTPKRIKDFLLSNGYMRKDNIVSGIDIDIKSSMKPLKDFQRLLWGKTLTEADVERIIERRTYTQDNLRFSCWLKVEYPAVQPEDVRYVTSLKYSDFGRLSASFLNELEGVEKQTGEVGTIMHFLWNTNNNLMQLLSDKFTFAENVEQAGHDYYGSKKASLIDRLDEMYIPNAVKRPILRALDIIKEVGKACNRAPKKIFIEMARGASKEQQGKRTKPRSEQLKELYARVRDEDVKLVSKQLAEMGENVDVKLQSEALYLYYLQLGRCMYTGEPIDITKLKDGTYNIDHIFPQKFVKDDSFDNKVLVDSRVNGEKKDVYPLAPHVRGKMRVFWENLHRAGLMSDEKLRRLTRDTGFTEEERLGFINRQLVETRQATKAIATLLKEMYPETEIVYVKAGLVSDFRNEFGLVKSRSVNDLHHAKDAYLNIVVGNVYNEKFSKRWFDANKEYSLKTQALFGNAVYAGGKCCWRGGADLGAVKAVLHKNNIHMTRYAFCRKGGLFDQMPLRAKAGLTPRKKGLAPQQYGGYNNTTASFFIAVRYTTVKKRDVMIVPVELMYSSHLLEDAKFAEQYAKETIEKITGAAVTGMDFPLGMRILKINTVFLLNGLRTYLSGKTSGGKALLISSMAALKLNPEYERYIKRLEVFAEKKKKYSKITVDVKYDYISKEENEQLYLVLQNKIGSTPFSYVLKSQQSVIAEGFEVFKALAVESQVPVLLQMTALLKTGRSGGCDLQSIGGVSAAGVLTLSSNISHWKKTFDEAYVVDCSAAGLFEKKSPNLFELL